MSSIYLNHISGVMVSVLASSAVDRGFESDWVKPKTIKSGICWFFTMHATLRRKSEHGFARNQDNVILYKENRD